MNHLGRALRELKATGLLLLQDPELPHLAALIAGATIRGAWWGHQQTCESTRDAAVVFGATLTRVRGACMLSFEMFVRSAVSTTTTTRSGGVVDVRTA